MPDENKADENKLVNSSVDSIEGLIKILTEVARRSAATQTENKVLENTNGQEKKEPSKVEIKVGNRVVYRDGDDKNLSVNLLKNKPEMVNLLFEKMQQPVSPHPSDGVGGSISVKVNDEPIFTMQDGTIGLNQVSTYEQAVIDQYQKQELVSPQEPRIAASQAPPAPPSDFLDKALAQQPGYQRAKIGVFEHLQESLGQALPQNVSNYLDSIRNRFDPSFQVDLKAAEMVATAKAVLHASGTERFEGQLYTFEQRDNALTVTSHERGVILKQENGAISSSVTAKDIKVFNSFNERYGPQSDQAYSVARNAAFIVDTVGAVIDGTKVYETKSYRIEAKDKDLQVFSGQALLLSVKNGKLEQSTFTSKDSDAFNQLADKLQSVTQKQITQREVSAPSIRR
jgi:plastocyanin